MLLINTPRFTVGSDPSALELGPRERLELQLRDLPACAIPQSHRKHPWEEEIYFTIVCPWSYWKGTPRSLMQHWGSSLYYISACGFYLSHKFNPCAQSACFGRAQHHLPHVVQSLPGHFDTAENPSGSKWSMPVPTWSGPSTSLVL